MKLPTILLFFLFLVVYSLVIWTNRSVYTSRFDEAYWKDRFEQSQWQIPDSPRPIGDDGLYQYEGAALVKGADPSTFNAEVPPLGKYLMGLSIRLFGNGHIYGLITTTLLLSVFLGLSYLFFSSLPLSIFLTLIVMLDPLILSQFLLTMLDSLLAFFLILYLALLLRLVKRDTPPRALDGIILGLVLGLFSETKVPVFSPILLVVGLAVLKKKHASLIALGSFGLGITTGYLIPYASYFSHGHTVLDWLRLQKWILTFYQSSKLAARSGSVLTTLLVGRGVNLFTGAWVTIETWTPLWSMIFLGSLASSFGVLRNALRHKDDPITLSWRAIALTLISILVFYALIPFWTRYLVLILPLMYLVTFSLIEQLPKKLSWVFLCGFLIINSLASFPIFFPSPKAELSQFGDELGKGFFRDVYEHLDRQTKKNMSREEFFTVGNRLFSEGEFEWVTVTPINPTWCHLCKTQDIPVQLTFFTRSLGLFTQHRTIAFVKENGAWAVAWQWDNLIGELSPISKLETTVIPTRRGAIQTNKKEVLAQDKESVLISLVPKEMDKTREQETLKLVERILDNRIPAYRIHLRYLFHPTANGVVPIGVVSHPLEGKDRDLLAATPGVVLSKTFGRFTSVHPQWNVGSVANTTYPECCSYLYSQSSYGGTSGLEQQDNETLTGKNGGTLILKDANRTVVRTLIDLPKQDGADVELPPL